MTEAEKPIAPERQLAAAVIRQAVNDAHAGHAVHRRQAAAWLMSPSSGLAWWCHIAGLDVEAIRQGVRRTLAETGEAGMCPTAPLRVCATAGCPNRVTRGHCPEHTRVQRQSRRPTDPRYGTQRWRRYSAARLVEHPFCVDCGRLAEVTDHVIPVTDRPDLFWEASNHASRCQDCNKRRDIERRGRIGWPA
jgi:5-methylcytosine-specific restriction endonuclease McrA